MSQKKGKVWGKKMMLCVFCYVREKKLLGLCACVFCGFDQFHICKY